MNPFKVGDKVMLSHNSTITGKIITIIDENKVSIVWENPIDPWYHKYTNQYISSVLLDKGQND